MQIIVLYVTTAVVFLGLDALMLSRVMKPLFARYLGDALLDTPRYGPAIGFYLFYIAGILLFASLPAMAADSATRAMLYGAALGAMAYGTYEFTNLATLRDWSWPMVATDFTWGIVLTGFSAWAGVVITRWLT